MGEQGIHQQRACMNVNNAVPDKISIRRRTRRVLALDGSGEILQSRRDLGDETPLLLGRLLLLVVVVVVRAVGLLLLLLPAPLRIRKCVGTRSITNGSSGGGSPGFFVALGRRRKQAQSTGRHLVEGHVHVLEPAPVSRGVLAPRPLHGGLFLPGRRRHFFDRRRPTSVMAVVLLGFATHSGVAVLVVEVRGRPLRRG
jgi:hypothetical protein